MMRCAQFVLNTVALTLLLNSGYLSEAHAIDRGKVSVKKTFSLAKLQSIYKKAESLQADIVQEVFQAALARTKTSKGSLTLAKPGMVKWEIIEPEASVMVSNGRKLWYFTPDAGGKNKGQVIERKAAELQKQPIFRILSGAAALDKEFNVAKQTELEGPGVIGEHDWMEITLKPKKSMGDLSEVKLRVSSKYLISELIIENGSGNKTKISLQNQALGAKLPPVLFDFKPPQGTEVIKNNE